MNEQREKTYGEVSKLLELVPFKYKATRQKIMEFRQFLEYRNMREE